MKNYFSSKEEFLDSMKCLDCGSSLVEDTVKKHIMFCNVYKCDCNQNITYGLAYDKLEKIFEFRVDVIKNNLIYKFLSSHKCFFIQYKNSTIFTEEDKTFEEFIPFYNSNYKPNFEPANCFICNKEFVMDVLYVKYLCEDKKCGSSASQGKLTIKINDIFLDKDIEKELLIIRDIVGFDLLKLKYSNNFDFLFKGPHTEEKIRKLNKLLCLI